MTDQQITDQVRTEMMAGAGGSLSVQVILGFLARLQQCYGPEFQIYYALQSLDEMILDIELTKTHLERAADADAKKKRK